MTTIFLKNSNEHFDHLRKIFERCREFGVSLNTKKSIFVVHEGKLLGYIVSKHDISIDLERVSAILSLPLLAHKKGLQGFLGRINFVRRFILDVVELLVPLNSMLKNNFSFS